MESCVFLGMEMSAEGRVMKRKTQNRALFLSRAELFGFSTEMEQEKSVKPEERWRNEELRKLM